MRWRAAAVFLLIPIQYSSTAIAVEVKTTQNVEDITKAAKASHAKIVWLQIWATECSPCMAEMPVLANIAKKYKDNADVAFIGLCLPSEAAAKKGALGVANSIVKKKELPYPNLLWLGTAEALQAKFNITGTPYNAVLNADGKVLDEVDVPNNEAKAAEAIEQAIQKALKTSDGKE